VTKPQDNHSGPQGDAGGRQGAHAGISDDRVWCLVPVYNNGDTLRDVVTGCREQLENVVVVDDGSTDADVGSLLAGLDVTLIRHKTNSGKGRAILTGLRHVRKENGACLITIDADGQHYPSDIGKFLPLLREDASRIIVGCRDLSGDSVPRGSRFGRMFSNLWIRLETGKAIPDTQCGFRAYPIELISRLNLRDDHYDFEVEVLTRAIWAGLRVDSVDIGVWYPPVGTERVTSFRPFVDNFRISLTHTRLVGRRMIPWPHKKLVKRKREISIFLHPREFFMSLLSEHATPSGLATSAAVGVFFGVLPLISLHMLVILYITARLRLNKVMALGIQNLCMPPFVPLACIELGHFMRYRRWLTEISLDTFVYQAGDRILEWFLGSLILAPVLAGIAALIVYYLARMTRNLMQKESC
jgi:glycosyltransferase involved in cell wall biosynthesis